MDPQRPPIPRNGGAKGNRDVGFHLRPDLAAVPLRARRVLPTGWIVSLAS